MKKTALFMAIMFALLAASSCGEKKKSTDKTSETAAVEETTASETTTMPAFEFVTVPVTDASEAELEAELAAIDPIAGTAFTKGSIEGNVYTSEFAGIKFTAPDEWTFKSDEDIETQKQQSMANMTAELKKISAMEITDAALINSESTKAIDFTYSNVKLKYPDDSGLSEEEFLDKDIFMGNLEEYKEKYGLKMSDPEKVTLGGKEFIKFMILKDVENSDDVIYIGRIDDDFILTIAAYGGAVTDTAAFESCFEAMN